MERKAGVGEKGLRKPKGGEMVDEAGKQPVYDKPKEAKGPAPRGAGPDTSVAVEFKGGNTRRIDFKMGAIEAIESHYPNKYTGNPATPISVILRWQQGGGMSWSQLKVFLWAGMLWETPHIQLEELDEMMDLGKIKYYSEKVDNGLQLAFGISEEDIAAAQKARAEQNEAAVKATAEKNGPLIGPS